MTVSDEDSGPEVYRLSRLFPADAAAAMVEQGLGSRPVRIERDQTSGSHAVFFATLADGRECVIKIATQAEHDLRLELWVAAQCRSTGVPVPAVLAAQPAPVDGSAPYVILERAPGIAGHLAALNGDERHAVFDQLGRYAAAIHHIRLPGFGKLQWDGEGYAGQDRSPGEYVMREVDMALEALPADALSLERKQKIRKLFEDRPALLELPEGRLVHGDYRFKNILVEGAEVRAILDFEMAVSADPATDLAWLLYSDGESEEDTKAVLDAYAGCGGAVFEAGFQGRLLLHQVRYALVHLWWEVSFQSEKGAAGVLSRLEELETALESLQ